MPAGLEIIELTKIFGHGQTATKAVDNISFSINKGELFSLLGESGCGKTTTLRMIAGLEQVTEGKILFGGNDFTMVPPNKRGTGMVFQSYALYPHMTIFENVAYGLRIRKDSKDEIKRKVNEALDIVDLPPDKYSSRRPSELSGGQQQRIALARALVYNPQVLLFDEPLSNLDAKLRVYMREEIRKVQQKLGITAVYVTHDQEEALAISDRIAIMFNGEIDQIGTPLEVYETPSTINVADFIGKANLISANLIKKNGTTGVAQFASGEIIEGLIKVDPDKLQNNVVVMIRPERVQLYPRKDVNSDRKNSIKATVSSLMYLGSRTRYLLDTTFGTTLTCDSVRLISGVEKGGEVWLSFEENEVLFLPDPSRSAKVSDSETNQQEKSL